MPVEALLVLVVGHQQLQLNTSSSSEVEPGTYIVQNPFSHWKNEN